MLGPVFRAYEPEQGRLVAVKLFQLDFPPDRVHRLLTELEVLLAADLAHPGIAAPVAAGLSGVSAYLAQDFVTADSLDTIARHGPSSVADVGRVVSQLGSALGAAAALGVFHGALHPRDVLISSDDARMTGIGVAQALERIGGVAPVRRPYSPPERMAGDAWDRRSDVFSLAALAFELLTARRIPGAGDVTADMMGDVPGDRQAIRRVFSRGLAEEPADRFDTSMAFADALQEALGRKSRTAPARLASKALPFEAAAAFQSAAVIEEPVRFAPVPVEELPLLTDEMLAEDSVDAFVDEAATADDRGAESPRSAPFPGPGASLAVGEFSLVARLPDDDLPLAARDAQPALADLHLSESANDDVVLIGNAEPEVAFSTLDLPPVAARTRESDETTRPLSVAPRERPTSIVMPPPKAADPPAPELNGVAGAAVSDAAASDRMSGVRPLILALVVGVAIGVPIGMFIAPERVTRRIPAASVPAAAATPTPIVEEPIREFTDRAAPREASPAGQASAAAPAASGTPTRPDAPTLRQPPAEPIPTPKPSAVDEPRLSTATAAGAATARTRGDRPEPRVERQNKAAGSKAAAARVPTAAAKPAIKPAAAPRARPPASTPAPARAAAPEPAKNEPGSLLVDSRPPGANVFLDGRLVGATPLVLSSVPLGDHAIHLERAGYQRWASSVTIVSGEQSRVKASLENR